MEKKAIEKKQRKPEEIYLDSTATKSLFCNKNMLKDVRKSKYVTEIQTNPGTGKVVEEGDVSGFTTVMFSKKLTIT